VGGDFCEGEERASIFRVFLCFFNCAKLPPLFVSCGPIFISKMLLGPQNWPLNFFFFL